MKRVVFRVVLGLSSLLTVVACSISEQTSPTLTLAPSVTVAQETSTLAAPSATAIPPEATSTPLPSILIPNGPAPQIDGAISTTEWEDATVEHFADGSELFLLHSNGFLFLGIRANTNDMIVGNVFVNRGKEISILHTSAALGTAIYQQDGNTWRQSKPFEWCCRDAIDSISAQAKRDEFFQQENWVSINSRIGTPNELEYQIKIGDEPIRLAVNYLTVTSNPNDEKTPWPTNLNDDVTLPTPGGLPSEMLFLPEQWGLLRFSSYDE